MFFFIHSVFAGICAFGLIPHQSLQAECEQTISIEQPAPLSIPELLDIALKNNPETRTAWWNAQRAAAASGGANSIYYPQINLQGSVAHGRDYRFINSNETTYTTASADLLLTYLLFDCGERRTVSESAKAALCAANWQSDWTLQKVMHNVIYNAYAYLNAQEQLRSMLASLQDANILLDAAKELQRVGLRSSTDIFSIKATISEMQIAIALQKAEAAIARAKLSASLGIDVAAELSVAALPDPPNDKTIQDNLQNLISTAHQKRADLMAKRADVQQKTYNRERVLKSRLPKVSVNADTGLRRYFEDKANGLNYNVGLYLDVPLFNGFEKTYQNRIAYSDFQISEAEFDRLELEIALEVLTFSRWFQAAQEILSFAEENLQNSLKTFDGVLEKYKAGTQSIFDLIAAQKQLADARLKHGDAKIRWYRSLAQLAYATGTLSLEVPCIPVN